MPHRGLVVPHTQVERLVRLLAELARRQALLAAGSAAYLTELMEALPGRPPPPGLHHRGRRRRSGLTRVPPSHRARARWEDRIRCGNDAGLRCFQFPRVRRQSDLAGVGAPLRVAGCGGARNRRRRPPPPATLLAPGLAARRRLRRFIAWLPSDRSSHRRLKASRRVHRSLTPPTSGRSSLRLHRHVQAACDKGPRLRPRIRKRPPGPPPQCRLSLLNSRGQRTSLRHPLKSCRPPKGVAASDNVVDGTVS